MLHLYLAQASAAVFHAENHGLAAVANDGGGGDRHGLTLDLHAREAADARFDAVAGILHFDDDGKNAQRRIDYRADANHLALKRLFRKAVEHDLRVLADGHFVHALLRKIEADVDRIQGDNVSQVGSDAEHLAGRNLDAAVDETVDGALYL